MPNVFVIAEAGVNHNGDLDKAYELIDVAAEAGADAVKFQTFSADRLASRKAPMANYQQSSTAQGESQYAMLKALELDLADHAKLQRYADKQRIRFLSTAFDEASLRYLDHVLDLPILKISSGDLTNGPLLLAFAKTGKRIILSTGMSTLGEVEDALTVIAYGLSGSSRSPSLSVFKEIYQSEKAQQCLKDKVTLLHCTSQYPAPYEEANLRAMNTLSHAFQLPVGYSDHTLGSSVSIAAVAMGACVIEKHLTLDKLMPGPDHASSLNPGEFRDMVFSIRNIEKALGGGIKKPSKSELAMQTVARRALRASHDLPAGHVLTSHDMVCLRPEGELSPMRYWDVVKKQTSVSIAAGDPIEC